MLAGTFRAAAFGITGAVQDENGVRADGDLLADLHQMEGHGLCIGVGQNQRCRRLAGGADRAENIGPFIALIARCAPARPAFGPHSRQRALLADASFVLKPDFEGFGLGLLGKAFGDELGEVFLKVSWASGSLFGCCGRTDKRR
jgi:hypothetical protein